jgi:hypothetical protein
VFKACVRLHLGKRCITKRFPRARFAVSHFYLCGKIPFLYMAGASAIFIRACHRSHYSVQWDLPLWMEVQICQYVKFGHSAHARCGRGQWRIMDYFNGHLNGFVVIDDINRSLQIAQKNIAKRSKFTLAVVCLYDKISKPQLDSQKAYYSYISWKKRGSYQHLFGPEYKKYQNLAMHSTSRAPPAIFFPTNFLPCRDQNVKYEIRHNEKCRPTVGHNLGSTGSGWKPKPLTDWASEPAGQTQCEFTSY